MRDPSAEQEEGKANKAILQLDDCLQEFAKEETLKEQDAWYCPKCKEFRCATKQFSLWKLPDLLIIHLKRVMYSGMWREKLQMKVDYPIEGLVLDEWTPNVEMHGRVYDLYAISLHFGGLGGGHYTAMCKNLIDGLWYNLDDSSASRVDSLDSLHTEAAYVLFYRLRE